MTLLAKLSGDHRSAASGVALWRVMETSGKSLACISIGGGPTRAHPRLKNLNLELLPNVDIVADAHLLPFRGGSLSAIHCEAVLEHLEYPDVAVGEMWRVLEPGGQIFAATPFLQAFHGYPSHYQNFTLVGHRRLFERAGFEVLDAGVCVGPTVALTDLAFEYLRELGPGPVVRRFLAWGVRLLLFPLRLVDRRANRRPNAHTVASTTFVHGRKSMVHTQDAT
jgi:SAM-dependent methyltransferase